jgi:beta-glucosidase
MTPNTRSQSARATSASHGRKPLFPFGWGLSYTTFRLDHLHVDPAAIGTGGETTVRVDATNSGGREGDEVVELHIHQRVASVTRPVMELRGFQRLSLKPGEMKKVEFKLKPRDLQMLNQDMYWVVELGVFDIMVGPSSDQTSSVPLRVVAK